MPLARLDLRSPLVRHVFGTPASTTLAPLDPRLYRPHPPHSRAVVPSPWTLCPLLDSRLTADHRVVVGWGVGRGDH